MKDDEGFTLLEVIVAMAIGIIALTALMRLFPLGLRQSRVAAERTVITRLANSRFDRIRAAGAEQLMVGQPMTVLVLPGLEQTLSAHALYMSWQQNVHRMHGAATTAFQRVTFSVEMADGRRESFVTYVARQ